MMSHTNQNKNIEIPGSSALLAGLGVDPSQLLPYLAAEGRPIPGIGTGGDVIDATENGMLAQAEAGDASPFGDSVNPPQAWSSLVVTPTPTPPASATVAARTPLPQLDQAELARSLAPFGADVLPLSQATSAGFRDTRNSPPIGTSPNASGFGPGNPPSFDPAPGRAVTGFGFGASDPVSSAWSQPAAFGVDAASTSSVAGSDSSALETRLARMVERLERIAEQFDQASASGRGGPSRSFRGRVDD